MYDILLVVNIISNKNSCCVITSYLNIKCI